MNPGRWLAGTAALAVSLLLMCTAALGSCAPLAGPLPPACHSPTPAPARNAGQAAPAPGPECIPPVAEWDHQQVANAAVIVNIGVDLDVPVWGQVIAVAAAMHQTRLRNLDHRDRVGLFGHRPGRGWGNRSQLLDPAHTAATFYHKLLEVDGWQQLPLSEAAHTVQPSTGPDAYTTWAGDAAALVGVVSAHPVGWVPPVAAPIISGFRTPTRPDHAGVDLGAPRHQIVVAASTGTVTTVACQARHLDGRPYGCDRDGHPDNVLGCGWYVDITHPDGALTRYCHLHTRPWVDEGQHVVAGQPIGKVGSTGRSSGPHLHYETWTITEGVPAAVDPVVFMRERGVPLQPAPPPPPS